MSITLIITKNTRTIFFLMTCNFLPGEFTVPGNFIQSFGEHPRDARQQPLNDTAEINLDASRSAGRLLR